MKKVKKNIFTSVSIPTVLFEKTKVKIKNTGFTSVSSYVAYILREVLTSNSSDMFKENDVERVREKLKELGYLD